MKKIIFVAIIAALMLAGCGRVAIADETVTVEDTIPVTIVEPVTEPVRATEPTENQFEYGQIVWSVIRSDAGGDAYLVRYMVFAQDGDIVSVIPMFNPDPDAVREVLVDVAKMPKGEAGYLDLVMVNNCYLDRDEAQAAADRENGEVEG